MDDNYPLNAIKSFLRIENPKIKDTPFYEINSSQNIITLYNPSEKKYSEKSSKFELDKIFTSDNENSYIFEEICLNTIKECLEGFSYSFISYGETASKKIDVLIGNVNDSVTNINNRGIFPRLLESLLMKINTDEKKYNLLMSFFMVYGNNLVDFSALKDIDNNISREDIFSKYFIIKNETDIIKNITKIKIENTEDNLSFINKVIFNLSKIEKETKEKIFSTSHICLILHLNEKQNNEIKNISNISFIILNGSEYLYSSGAKKLKIKDNENNNSKSLKTKKVEGAKNTLETQFTFETIFNCIKSVKCLNIKKFGNQKENFLFSQLTTVLYNICFGDDIEKIKFRIIGTIYPNTGYYLSAKDTIVFLYECRNIMKRKIINSKNLESQNETTSEIVEKKKDDYIFQLETKVKDQKNRINELSKDISRKEDKINFLQKTYKEQINTVKKKLNFPGNINVLIAGGENTKEATFAREMRDYQDCIKRHEGNIHLLEKQLKEAKEEITKLKNKNVMKNNDETMINYYVSLRQEEEIKKMEQKSLGILYNQIDDLKKEIKVKDQVNKELQKEIKNKNNILFNLPLALKENYSLNKQMININNNNKNKRESLNKSIKDSEIKSEKEQEPKEKLTESNNSKSEEVDNDTYYGEKIKKIKDQNLKNMMILKNKYEDILFDKNKEFDDIKINLEKMSHTHTNEIISWKKELLNYNKKFMELISNYKRIFCSKIPPQCNIVTLKNKKEEFDNILFEVEKEINFSNFPKLFRELEIKNNLAITETGSVANMRKTLAKKIHQKIMAKENDKKSEENSENLKNLKISTPSLLPLQQIKKGVEEKSIDKKSIKTRQELENMSKEAIIIQYLNLNKKIEEMENYFEKYTQYRKGFNIEAFENNVNYKENVIKELNDKIKKLTNNLDEQIQANYNYMNVIKTQNRIIEKLKKEKLYNNVFGKNRNFGNSNFIVNENSTSSSLINSINRNLITNNFLMEGKKMRKSNSCQNINIKEYKEHKKSKIDYNQYLGPGKTSNLDKINMNKSNSMCRKIRPFSSIGKINQKQFIK